MMYVTFSSFRGVFPRKRERQIKLSVLGHTEWAKIPKGGFRLGFIIPWSLTEDVGQLPRLTAEDEWWKVHNGPSVARRLVPKGTFLTHWDSGSPEFTGQVWGINPCDPVFDAETPNRVIRDYLTWRYT